MTTTQGAIIVGWLIFCAVMLYRSHGAMAWYVAMMLGALVLGWLLGVDWSALRTD